MLKNGPFISLETPFSGQKAGFKADINQALGLTTDDGRSDCLEPLFLRSKGEFKAIDTSTFKAENNKIKQLCWSDPNVGARSVDDEVSPR